jgi:hypothetical protein
MSRYGTLISVTLPGMKKIRIPWSIGNLKILGAKTISRCPKPKHLVSCRRFQAGYISQSQTILMAHVQVALHCWVLELLGWWRILATEWAQRATPFSLSYSLKVSPPLLWIIERMGQVKSFTMATRLTSCLSCLCAVFLQCTIRVQGLSQVNNQPASQISIRLNSWYASLKGHFVNLVIDTPDRGVICEPRPHGEYIVYPFCMQCFCKLIL